MISWLTNTRSAKVCGLFSWLCCLDADWLGRQTPITWKSDWKICVRRQEMLQNSNDPLPSPPKVEVLQQPESPSPLPRWLLGRNLKGGGVNIPTSCSLFSDTSSHSCISFLFFFLSSSFSVTAWALSCSRLQQRRRGEISDLVTPNNPFHNIRTQISCHTKTLCKHYLAPIL